MDFRKAYKAPYQPKKKKKEAEAKKEEDEEDKEGGDEGPEAEEPEDAKGQEEEEYAGNPAGKLKGIGHRVRPQMKKEQIDYFSQLRRWDIRIANVSIENLYNESFDPFIEFVIGGDFRIVPRKVKGGKVENVYQGTLGYTQKTEVAQNLAVREIQSFQTRVRHEYVGSYFNVEEQFLRMDIWDWEKWSFNQFYGRLEVPLIEFIQGDVQQELEFFKAGNKKKVKLCRLRFNVMFQEIWDYYLLFNDWGASNIKDIAGKRPKIHLELRMNKQRIRTKPKRELNPQWAHFPKGIHFRGTRNDLENAHMVICCYNRGKRIAMKTIEMTGVIESGVNVQAPNLLLPDEREIAVKGRVNVMKHPRHQQVGELINLRSDQHYLCVKILRVDKVVLPNDRGVVNTFIDVKWAGSVKRTRTAFQTFRPIFDDRFYYPIVVNEGRGDLLHMSSLKSVHEQIQEELNQQSVMTINLWSIDEKQSNENLGFINFHLGELESASNQELSYYDEKYEKNTTQRARVWSGQKPLKTPILAAGEESHVYFEVYLLSPEEANIEYDDIPRKKEEPMPPDCDEELIKWKEEAQSMKDYFADESQREFSWLEKDEKSNKHFLPMFLTKMSYPSMKSTEPKKVKKPKASKKKKKAEEEDKEDESNETMELDTINLKATYIDIETPANLAYFVSLIQFTANPDDVWMSPEFFIRTGKGDAEDHSILLANLYMGIEQLPTDKVAWEHRTFVCVGSMKQRKSKHVWVMTIDEGCRDITFWETTNSRSFSLEGRVENPKELRNMLLKKPKKSSKKKKKSSSKSKGLEEEKSEMPDDDDDQPSADSDDEPEIIEDHGPSKKNKADDLVVRLSDVAQNARFRAINRAPATGDKAKKKLDDMPARKPGRSYVGDKANKEVQDESQKDTINRQPHNFPVPVFLPYHTIDLIFNGKNIYLNKQYFDPAKIHYDLQNTEKWHSFFVEDREVPPFYSPPLFAPPLKRAQISKLENALFSEIQKSVSAFRSGKNLATFWKKKSARLNEHMEHYLTCLENNAAGNCKGGHFERIHEEWQENIRQELPEEYRVSALPAQFTYSEPDRISSVLLKNARDFFELKQQNMKWALAVKVYSYVGKVISVRVLLVAAYPIPITEAKTSKAAQ